MYNAVEVRHSFLWYLLIYIKLIDMTGQERQINMVYIVSSKISFFQEVIFSFISFEAKSSQVDIINDYDNIVSVQVCGKSPANQTCIVQLQ